MNKVLVTGAAGFIGSHLTELLVTQGYNVSAFIHYNSRNNWGWIEQSTIKEQISIFQGDIRDYDSVCKALKGCDTVFHLAALIGIPYSYVSPKAYIETNIIGTYNILQAAKDLGTEQILITSTSETYGSAQYIPIDELHPLVGQSPYSATKIAADELAISYYRSYNLPVKIVRPFNTYGPRQSARAIIPTVIAQLLNGEGSISVGSINPTRDLTYVKDTCKGFLEISKSALLFGQVTNIGMKQEISIRELIFKIGELLNVNPLIHQDAKRIRPEKSEVERLYCDNTKILENTLWMPDYSLEGGLKETISWIKDNLNYYKTKIYNV